MIVNHAVVFQCLNFLHCTALLSVWIQSFKSHEFIQPKTFWHRFLPWLTFFLYEFICIPAVVFVRPGYSDRSDWHVTVKTTQKLHHKLSPVVVRIFKPIPKLSLLQTLSLRGIVFLPSILLASIPSDKKSQITYRNFILVLFFNGANNLNVACVCLFYSKK